RDSSKTTGPQAAATGSSCAVLTTFARRVQGLTGPGGEATELLFRRVAQLVFDFGFQVALRHDLFAPDHIDNLPKRVFVVLVLVPARVHLQPQQGALRHIDLPELLLAGAFAP